MLSAFIICLKFNWHVFQITFCSVGNFISFNRTWIITVLGRANLFSSQIGYWIDFYGICTDVLGIFKVSSGQGKNSNNCNMIIAMTPTSIVFLLIEMELPDLGLTWFPHSVQKSASSSSCAPHCWQYLTKTFHLSIIVVYNLCLLL